MGYTTLSRAARALLLTLVLGTALGTAARAQKANFEQAQRFTTQMMDKMTGSTSVDPHWIENSDQFWYSYKSQEGKNWWFVNAAKKSKQPLFDQDAMAAKLAETFHKPFNSKELPLKDFKYDTDQQL